MADFGRTDEFAPDSELNSDSSESVLATLADGTQCEILKNDWVDGDESLQSDPMWGYSFQVSRITDGSIFIKAYVQHLDVYEETQLDASLIWNVYRHVEKTEI